jgi:hypothetical protein
MSETNVAIYLDFENLAISAEQVYPSKDMPLNLRPILDYAASLGNICIKKAYADWLKPAMSQYQRTLVESGFELVHLPETTSQGKNGGDVRLAFQDDRYIRHRVGRYRFHSLNPEDPFTR